MSHECTDGNTPSSEVNAVRETTMILGIATDQLVVEAGAAAADGTVETDGSMIVIRIKAIVATRAIATMADVLAVNRTMQATMHRKKGTTQALYALLDRLFPPRNCLTGPPVTKATRLIMRKKTMDASAGGHGLQQRPTIQ